MVECTKCVTKEGKENYQTIDTLNSEGQNNDGSVFYQN